MAYSTKDWDIVKAFYERGLSLAEIVARPEVNIKSRSQISRKAASEGWKKGTEKEQLVTQEAQTKQSLKNIQEKKETFNATELYVHNELVSKQLEGMEFYATNARKVAKVSLSSLAKDQTAAKAKIAMETLKTGMVVEGLVPYYPNAATINNTNAQQNNGEPEQITKIERVIVRPANRDS